MRFLSLFSGIEAASVAWLPLGWRCVGVAEIEAAPCKILKHHYPDVPNLGDVTKITEEQIIALGHIDVVVFGSPCQDLSIAGKRKGLLNADGTITRSGLFFSAINIFQWARKHCGTRFALWENVAGAYSSNKGKDFASVVAFMAGLEDLGVPANGWGTEGAALGDNGMLEWACLDAQWFGVAQRRRRVFALLDTGNWVDRSPILLERVSLRGDTAPRREAGQGITHDLAPCLTSSGRGVERVGDTRGQDPVVLVHCLAHGQGGAELGIDRSPTLTCNHEAPIAAYSVRTANTSSNGRGIQEEFVHALDCTTGPAIAYSVALRGRDGGNTAELGDEVATCLRASGGGSDKAHVLTYAIQAGALRTNPASGPDGVGIQENIAYTLEARAEVQAIAFSCKDNGGDATVNLSPTLRSMGHAGSHQNGGGQMAVCIGLDEEQNAMIEAFGTLKARTKGGGFEGAVMTRWMAVRRLLPTECEALQGFDKNYTRVPNGKKMLADGPRYKALGNSMCVNVMRYIGERIQAAVYEVIERRAA